MTWLLVDLVATGVFLAVMLAAVAAGQDRALGSHLRLRAWHHGYAGAALILLSLVVPWSNGGGLLHVLGSGLLYDDTGQHAVQLVTGKLGWRSPLHRWYRDATLRWSWLRKVEQWLDARFGTVQR